MPSRFLAKAAPTVWRERTVCRSWRVFRWRQEYGPPAIRGCLLPLIPSVPRRQRFRCWRCESWAGRRIVDTLDSWPASYGVSRRLRRCLGPESRGFGAYLADSRCPRIMACVVHRGGASTEFLRRRVGWLTTLVCEIQAVPVAV